MFWIDFILVLFFALILSSILSWGFGWRHPARSDAAGVSFLFMFLILLFAMWGAGVWFRPWGLVFYDSPWLGILLIGLFVSLLIMAISGPSRKPRSPMEAEKKMEEEAAVVTVFGLFFWILIFGLIISVVVSYFI